MDSDYDQKFDEMKQYIPFLENMITRLESNTLSSSNPRQAQLDKIRSLRDLLCNKKKRMKMENLLKCEQVLINLYAKVEQRDTLSGVKKSSDSGFSIDTPTQKEKSDLEAVRNKLKTVAKLQEDQDTLPEILPRNEVIEVHTSGTKEPALFQRRPNQPSNQTNQDFEESKVSPPGSGSKRNYTRVLVSPESSSQRWSKSPVEKPLFSRRSPRKSPKRYSPTYYKKERKKSKDSQSRKRKDLNITLNVPEESLNSLNTKDILSRIITCSDGDVDIDTLRELRKQILGELKKTGAKDDISDLILKSYNKNNTSKKTAPKKDEVEEGELSDSESEAIESIYGSLVVKEPNHTKTSTEKESQPRKIQICLVINSDDNLDAKMPKQDASADFAELQMYEDDKKVINNPPITTEQNNQVQVNTAVDQNKPGGKVENDISKLESNKTENETVAAPGKDNVISTSVENIISSLKESVSTASIENATATLMENDSPKDNIPITKEQGIITPLQDNVTINVTENAKTPLNENVTPEEQTQFKANFYKPLMEYSSTETKKDESTDSTSVNKTENITEASIPKFTSIENTLKQMESSPEIPLLHERTIEKKPPESTLSEIDILQALKNEILSDIPVPGAETTTPALHQPKIIKVASAQELLPKKRISIEKYKEKSVTSSKSHLHIKDQKTIKEDQIKKPSLKLTDKECERFFNVPKISFDDEDESLDEDDMDIEDSDIYDDLAPKSPDHDESSNISSAPPVIIPVDRVKILPATSKADIDMRTLPIPNSVKVPLINNISMSSSNDLLPDKNKSDINIDKSNAHNRPTTIDPRVRRDFNPSTSNLSPKPHTNNPERTPRHNVYPGSSTSNPVMTPNSRTYEMTPTHQSFDIDQTSRKHVYVPTMTSNDLREGERPIPMEARSWENTDSSRDRKSRWDDIPKPPPNYGISDVPATSPQPFGRLEMPMTPLPSFGRSDCPTTPNHSFGSLECPPTPSHSFGRLECPPTPSNTFGRLECPPTPNHTFGRLECPSTPSHPFGRLECPSTPVHPYGRLECPSTPTHPFGRQECPPTPNHPFGRLDCPSTPSHPFGRNDVPSFIPNLMDCPSTPINPFAGADFPPTANTFFGRNEVPSNPNHTYVNSDSKQVQNRSFGFHDKPQTPSHYGRPDPSKSQYSRSDSHNPKFTKDPRLNRSQKDEKNHNYYKDQGRYHGNSYSSEKAHSGTDNYRKFDREASSSRNSNHSFYGSDQRGSRYNKDLDRRELSVGRSMSRSRENDEVNKRERRFASERKRNDEVISRREYNRDVSVAQNRSDDPRTARASSVGKTTNSRQLEHNSLSVKSNTGRSFTIDTSVNATFHKIIDSANEIKEIVNSFDMRKQRAASVGRSLNRDTSVGRTLLKDPKDSLSACNENKREAFRRASSVGRDIRQSNSDNRTFQEIKADFKSCSFPAKEFSKARKSPNTFKSKDTVEHSARSRKDIHEKQKNDQCRREPSKSSYSPRKNCRDPRMRRQFEEKNDRHSSNISRRKSGIVYSNDNIVTGSILASGYGVKNYKIPKIKRAIEEKEAITENADVGAKDEKEKEKSKNSDKMKEKGVDKEKPVSKDEKSKENIKKSKQVNTAQNVNVKEINQTPCVDESKDDSFTEGRQTRSSKKTMDSKSDIEIVSKTKKYKKVIFDSDSDNEVDNKDQGTEDKPEPDKEDRSNNKTKTKVPISPVKQKRNSQKLDAVDLDSSISSFGIDELEMFSDNIVSDPDNINALIADLDDDLSTSKSDTSHNFTNEISLENMLENISSPEKDNLSQMDDESVKILEEIDKISSENNEIPSIEKDRDNVSQRELKFDQTQKAKIEQISSKNEISEMNPSAVSNTPTQSDSIHKEENESSDNMTSTTLVKCSNTDIDSTSELQKEAKPSADDKSKLADQAMDACSTPDSTINTDDAVQTTVTEDSLPGSTNEVSSTETIESKDNSALKESIPGLGSIGSLLSMLQDKTKIKGLLEMLGDQSTETEKIKKKLEKLCEIPSDDEETCDVPSNTSYQAEKSELLTESSAQDHENKDYIDHKNEKILEDEQSSRDSISTSNEIDSKQDDDDTKTSDIEVHTQETETDVQNEEVKPKKPSKPVKRTKGSRKFKGKAKKVVSKAQKRVTRATAIEKPKVKKVPRELTQLQEDIKEMFIRDDVLSATGIRMCRLAKLIDEKIPVSKEEQDFNESEPVVVLQKFKDAIDKTAEPEKGKKKKNGPKNKLLKISRAKIPEIAKLDKTPISKNKPGPKSKTKQKKEADPYAFETDSLGDTSTEKASDYGSSCSSESESDSLASTKSFDSTEPLSDVKKKTKRKRRGWQAGVIKPKTKKKKVEPKHQQPNVTVPEPFKVLTPDLNCFTDRNYCFRKNEFVYSCRLCSFSGADIILHYRNEHPHVEIPLSRMTPEVAQEAIEQCEEINFKAISKIPSEKYVCTFCFKEFGNSKSVLETFFWHIVSMHTGEYKQNCSKCPNANDCPINLDIPPPPKDIKGQLIGYICKKCNFTQISLENLKTHVIVRHNDEQTAVYTINLSVMTKKTLSSLLRRSEAEQVSNAPSYQISTEKCEKHRESIEKDNEIEGRKTRTSMRKPKLASLPIQSKITFEGDDNISELSDNISETEEATIKIEKVKSEITDEMSSMEEGPPSDISEIERPVDEEPSNDNVVYPQFIIQRIKSGAKEYFCCIDDVDPHYNTIIAGSLKKHLRMKHVGAWDGYCQICKEIVMHKRGRFRFIDCLQHYMANHVSECEVEAKPEPEELYNIIKPLGNTETAVENTPDTEADTHQNNLRLSTEAAPSATVEFSESDLEAAFGSFGSSKNDMICCPKCSFESKNEEEMRYHLEMELNKINILLLFRWRCSSCSEKFQLYHEAQLHCKGHDGPSRPLDAVRDSVMRAAWVSTVLQKQTITDNPTKPSQDSTEPMASDDIVDYPHFKINHTESGAKEYYCCINGSYHFKTTLLISMKKHVQTKHSEKWDGYCYLCKVIVTPQGAHHFKDCLQHYLNKHMDNFPIFEKETVEPATETPTKEAPSVDRAESPSAITVAPIKPAINVESLLALNEKTVEAMPQKSANIPVIQSVVSLGASAAEPCPVYPTISQTLQGTDDESFKYEEHQTEIMSKKYYLVVESMVTHNNLIKVFKCSGTYCSYTTDSAEEALAHATTHQRIGGADALHCSYCNFSSGGNAVDLVMHVFKRHGCCSFCCPACFYRAASSQAVAVHAARAHGVAPTDGTVLRTTVPPSIAPTQQRMLTRQEAVSYYDCPLLDDDKLCKFRSYTAEKILEHISQKHPTAQQFPCLLCTTRVQKREELVQHMKTHNVRLYQCTWCVHGTDNEIEMLAHFSSRHPDKLPQAYIRIITNKEGSNALRVLPLAYLNKNKVVAIEMTPTATKENPVREAERSVEMEALIGPYMSDLPSAPEKTTEPIVIDTNIIQTSAMSDIEAPQDTTEPDLIVPEALPLDVPPPIETVASVTAAQEVRVSPILIQLPAVKTEPVEEEEPPFEVVILDSDDDEVPEVPPTPVIHLSDEESMPSFSLEKQAPKMIPDERLNTCPKCGQVCKNIAGLKKHLSSCVKKDDTTFQCPHCQYSGLDMDNLLWHYVANHSEKKTFECGLCGTLLATENFARKHMRNSHKESNMIVVRNEKEGLARYTVNVRPKVVEPPKERTAPKRKLSGPVIDSNGATPTKRRFEPQEIGLLPINPILDHNVYCAVCEFSTKVRLNMYRHLQLHAEQQPVAHTAPVNPVPHLESNEKHFDKMVNLASSSAVTRTPDKARQEHTPAVSLILPPAAASRFPKYVSDRTRHACGAAGCSYISVDEAMLRCHWDTLHSDCNDYHCVHCPPNQHLDTSKPLTANRIISHLKMHNATLYACSKCVYYHYKRGAVEKHMSDNHKGGRVLVVREEYSASVASPTMASVSAPTMDLKPWQCGVCKFKSMLRPEVIDHCSKVHQQKMQFKCGYCSFMTSAVENVARHQMNSHAGQPEDVFYYYYREGSIPDGANGTPQWVKQSQNMAVLETEIKVEVSVPTEEPEVTQPINIDLNLVKKEVDVTSSTSAPSMEELCNIFGKFCEPNGIKFKCPLCSVVMEDTREGMQSHLYEELNYRKWSCGLCSYKAHHKAGLINHMSSEHRRQYDHVQLPTDMKIEIWVAGVLDHQAAIIEKHKQNLSMQKIIIEVKPSVSSIEKPVPKDTVTTYPESDLEKAFGPFGESVSYMYCCPKCGFTCKKDSDMKNHLEVELNKIRWRCSNCPDTFQMYHEAQLHCKGHDGPSRPIEAKRDPAMRAAWLATVIQKQTKVDRPRKDSTTTEIPQKEFTKIEIPQKESTSTDIPRKESTSTEIPHKQSSSTEIPRKESTSTDIPRIDTTSTVILRKQSTSTVIPRKESTSTDIPRKQSSLTEIPQKETTTTKTPARNSVIMLKVEPPVTTQPMKEVVTLDLDTSSESEDQLYIDQTEYKNVDFPHFTIKQTQTGYKEYYCSIDSTFAHYHSTNTGSMRKHLVQRHSGVWDGYCYECKARVNLDNKDYTHCLQHYIHKHADKDVKTPEKAPAPSTDTMPATAKSAATEIVLRKETTGLYPDKDLETAFGVFGSPDNDMFCCPKCTFLCAKEDTMSDHLDMELNKIRWNCSNCTEKFQTYHEARFHTKSHNGPCRPIEAMRSPTMRAAWVSTAIQRQKSMIDNTCMLSDPSTSDKNLLESDNSLLVVRYEERVPTPDQVPIRRKRKATDSEDDEYSRKQKHANKQCPHCVYKTYNKSNLKIHILTHYNLKAYSCTYCKFNACTKKIVTRHTEEMHPGQLNNVKMTEVPEDTKLPTISSAAMVVTCLVCEKSMFETDSTNHRHDNVKPDFAKVDIVVKCCICLTLCLDTKALQTHHDSAHPGEPVNYAMYKLGFDSRETYSCAYCNNRFKYIKDYRAHHVAVHTDMPFNIASSSYRQNRSATGPVVPRRCARKSTTKLPNSVAKKSTTKLPYSVPNDEGYSYYGTRPTPLNQYSDVTTLMPFCNRMVPFSLKQLSEHLNIEPLVVVTDIKKASE